MANIISQSDVDTYLGTQDTARTSQLLPMVDSIVKNFTRRNVLTQTNTDELHHGEGSPFLFTLDAPITSVATLKLVDPAGVTVQTFTTDEFVIVKQEYIQLVGSNIRRPAFFIEFPVFFPVGENNVSVTYNSGFSVIPEDIKLAALRIFAFYLRQRTTGMKSERIGDYSYTRDDSVQDANSSGIPAEAKALLRRYQRIFMRRATLPTDLELRRLR